MALGITLTSTAIRKTAKFTDGFGLGAGTMLGAVIGGALGIAAVADSGASLLVKLLSVLGAVGTGLIAGGAMAKDGLFRPQAAPVAPGAGY